MSDDAEPDAPDVRTAIRLGWAVAELRGRCWPDGPRPTTSTLPTRPAHTLPLRSQRADDAARVSAVSTLLSLAAELQVPTDDAVEELAEDRPWEDVSTYIFELDARIQDSLTTRSEAAANAYLLARGLAECYWGLGPDGSWRYDGEDTGVSLRFLFGQDRRRELTRMLGRLESGQMHPLSASAISGSIEAWGQVADDPTWAGTARPARPALRAGAPVVPAAAAPPGPDDARQAVRQAEQPPRLPPGPPALPAPDPHRLRGHRPDRRSSSWSATGSAAGGSPRSSARSASVAWR